jgi:hypothetical protein
VTQIEIVNSAILNFALPITLIPITLRTYKIQLRTGLTDSSTGLLARRPAAEASRRSSVTLLSPSAPTVIQTLYLISEMFLNSQYIFRCYYKSNIIIDSNRMRINAMCFCIQEVFTGHYSSEGDFNVK